MGMPAGFAELLAQKYSIMRQQADTQSMAAKAAANLDNVRAGLMPAESMANVDRTKAETGLTAEQAKYFGQTALANIGLTKANTRLTDTQAEWLPKTSMANIGETNARAGLIGLQGTALGQTLSPLEQLFPGLTMEKVQGRGGGLRDIRMRPMAGGLDF